MVLFCVVHGVRMENIYYQVGKMILCKYGAWMTERWLHGARGIHHGLAQLPLIRIGPLQILMKQKKMSCIGLVLLARIPNFFSGIWQWMRLLCHYDILPAAPLHLAVEALLHTGTVHALLLVFFSRLHGCKTYQSSHPLLHTEYMLIPFLA